MLQLVDLTVISIVADGASNNRKFFRLHKILKYQQSEVTYMAPNIMAPSRFVYFIADAPHLLKTVRNAWYNSQTNRTRSLVVNKYLCTLLAYNVAMWCRTKDVTSNGHILWSYMRRQWQILACMLASI